MAHPAYIRASSRSDLSQWVVHFVRTSFFQLPNLFMSGSQIFHNIMVEGQIRPSMSEQITRCCSSGATCFYDIPPKAWPEVISTNPNSRLGLGIIVHKSAFWSLGGRPVIYTDITSAGYWPESERYRLVHTDLLRHPQPIDWTHEREGRLCGPLRLYQQTFPYVWWWPVVPSEDWLPWIWQSYPWVQTVYVMSLGYSVSRVLPRLTTF